MRERQKQRGLLYRNNSTIPANCFIRVVPEISNFQIASLSFKNVTENYISFRLFNNYINMQSRQKERKTAPVMCIAFKWYTEALWTPQKRTALCGLLATKHNQFERLEEKQPRLVVNYSVATATFMLPDLNGTHAPRRTANKSGSASGRTLSNVCGFYIQECI